MSFFSFQCTFFIKLFQKDNKKVYTFQANTHHTWKIKGFKRQNIRNISWMAFCIDFFMPKCQNTLISETVYIICNLQADICLACCFASNEKSFMMMPENVNECWSMQMLIAMHSILEMGPLEPYFTFQRHLSHCVKKVALVNQDFEADSSFFTFRLYSGCMDHMYNFFYHLSHLTQIPR